MADSYSPKGFVAYPEPGFTTYPHIMTSLGAFPQAIALNTLTRITWPTFANDYQEGTRSPARQIGPVTGAFAATFGPGTNLAATTIVASAGDESAWPDKGIIRVTGAVNQTIRYTGIIRTTPNGPPTFTGCLGGAGVLAANAFGDHPWLTIPFDGYYSALLHASWASAGTGRKIARLSVIENTTAATVILDQDEHPSVAGDPFQNRCHVQDRFVVGDAIDALVLQGDAASLNLGNNPTATRITMAFMTP